MNANKIAVLTEEELQELLMEAVQRALQLYEGQYEAEENLLTTKQVCTKYGISRMTLSTYSKEGRLSAKGRKGKQMLYSKSDCDKILLKVRKMNQHH